MASGLPFVSITSASPPADRMRSHTHSAARLTSAVCASSALIDGIAISSASSGTRVSSDGVTAGECIRDLDLAPGATLTVPLMEDELMTIGAFARSTGLSAKALRARAGPRDQEAAPA